MKFLRGKNSIVKRFLVSYLLVLMFMVIPLIPIYRIMVNSVSEKAITETNHRLDNGIESLNSSIVSINHAVYNLLSNADIRSIINVSELGAVDYYYMTKAQKQLRAAIEPYQIVYNSMLLTKNNNIAITLDRIYDERDGLYNDYIRYEGLSQEKWLDLSINDCQNKTFMQETVVNFHGQPPKEVLTYFLAYNSKKASGYDCTFSILIDKEDILRLLTTSEAYANGWLYIQNMNGDIILRHHYSGDPITVHKDNKSFVEEINGEETTVFYRDAFDTGIRIVLGVPASSYASDVNKAKSIVIICFLLTFLVGLVLSLLMSYYNSKPILKIVSLIDRKGLNSSGNSGEYDRILSAIESLFQSKEALFQQLENNRNSMTAGLFERLLHSAIYIESELDVINKYINFLPESYALLNIRIGNLNNAKNMLNIDAHDTDVFRTVLAAFLRENCFVTEFIHITGDSNIIVLVETIPESNSLKAVSKKIEEVQKQIFSDFKLVTFCGISNIHKDYFELAQAFTESEKALNCIIGTPFVSRILYSEINSGQFDMWLDINENTRLFQMLIAGDKEKVVELLAVIFERNSNRILSNVWSAKQLYYTLRGILISASRETGHDTAINSLPNYKADISVTENFDIITDQMTEFCEIVQARHRSRNLDLKNSIIEYINNNYADVDLYAKTLSEIFNVSEKYMYSLVKERTGMSLSSYVEKVRLEQAILKMMNTDLSIADIATSCGFISQNTFYKAFKRVYAVSPRTWRTINQNRNDSMLPEEG